MGNASTKRKKAEEERMAKERWEGIMKDAQWEPKLDLITLKGVMSLTDDRKMDITYNAVRSNIEKILRKINDKIRQYCYEHSVEETLEGVDCFLKKNSVNAGVPKFNFSFNSKTYLGIVQELLNERLEEEGADWRVYRIKSREDLYCITVAFVLQEEEEESSSGSFSSSDSSSSSGL